MQGLSTYAALGGFGLSVVALAVSAFSVMVHWLRRHSDPVLGPIEAEIQSLKTAQADLVDRVEHWQRRDRTRRIRKEQQDEQDLPQPEPSPAELKRHLRLQAKQLGVLR